MTSPLVSIGLPVYNGERFLARALDTLLTQDVGDFELIISDNASTDGTELMCRRYAGLDRRIRYVRQPRNRGAAWNFTQVLALADPGARYVKWAAADDEHHPAFLSDTLTLLEADPSASLAHTATADIDEESYIIKRWHQPVDRLVSPDPAERLRDLLTLRHECFGAFGLIRHDVARATRGLGPYSDADNVFLVEIALRGPMLHSPNLRFFRRQHADRSTVAYPVARGRVEWFDADRAPVVSFPVWRVGGEFLRAIRDAPLSSAERRRCYRSMEVFLHDNWQGLTKNVVRSAAEASSLQRWRRRASAPAGDPTGAGTAETAETAGDPTGTDRTGRTSPPPDPIGPQPRRAPAAPVAAPLVVSGRNGEVRPDTTRAARPPDPSTRNRRPVVITGNLDRPGTAGDRAFDPTR